MLEFQGKMIGPKINLQPFNHLTKKLSLESESITNKSILWKQKKTQKKIVRFNSKSFSCHFHPKTPPMAISKSLIKLKLPPVFKWINPYVGKEKKNT